MPRYRETAQGAVAPEEKLASHANDNMLLVTSFMGLFIGIALAIMGKYGKQLWMLVWGIGLFFASGYLAYFMWFERGLGS